MSAIQQLLAGYKAAGSDPNFANVSLLLHCDGTNGSSTFTDNSPSPKTITALNGANIATAQFKFGNASAYFDGSNDHLEGAASADYQFGTGDFTVEFFLRFFTLPTVEGAAGLIGTYNSSTGGWLVQRSESSGGLLRFLQGDTVLLSAAWAPGTNTWYHIAVTRSGSSLRVFVNGSQIGSTVTDSTNLNSLTPLTIGRLNLSGGLQHLNAYMDEIRITKGVARYTSNFSVPTEAFPNS